MTSKEQWIRFPDERVSVLGLPWFNESQPDLWRLPGHMQERVPDKVCAMVRYPSGGRIRFSCATSRLRMRVKARSPVKNSGMDAFVNGFYWKSELVNVSTETEITFFDGVDKSKKDITVYLPNYQEIEITEIGVDSDAIFSSSIPFEVELPLVFYGSSVAQGAGAPRSSMSYGATISRCLNLDYVNLGFGGAGRAEKNVVEIVNRIEASCYILDLGKSYGLQPKDAYASMLSTIRSSHPDTPIICVTPIFSTREHYSADYRELSNHTREVMRQSTLSLTESGDTSIHILSGLDLLGPDDADGLSKDGVHPSELGYTRIAEGLCAKLRDILFPR